MVYDITAAILKNGGKSVFIDFIEIFQSKMKRLHVNKNFDLIIFEKIEDSKLNLMQMCSRLYELLTSFLHLEEVSVICVLWII